MQVAVGFKRQYGPGSSHQRVVREKIGDAEHDCQLTIGLAADSETFSWCTAAVEELTSRRFYLMFNLRLVPPK